MALLFRVFATLSIGIALTPLHAQMTSEQQQAILLKRMIERNHYSPRAVDDSFSSTVFNKIFKEIGEAKFLFTANEYNSLAAFRHNLDDELNGGTWKFLHLLTNVYAAGAKRADSMVNVLLQKPLDLSVDDKLTLSREQNFFFANSVTDMHQLWQKRLKWQLLNKAYDLSLSQLPRTSVKEILAKNEAALRRKIKTSALAELPDYKNQQVLAEEIKEIYLNAVATTFDPHTQFFSPEQKQNFQASLSTEGKSFGFMIGEKEGKVVVQHLIPGGPAWKSGELHRNDQLLQASFDGKEVIDVTMLSPEELEELVEGSSVTNVLLKIKKTDGSLKTVTLHKELIETEENSVKGYVLKGKEKLGYISLPDFYTEWNEGIGSSCADDVAKTIVNLKKENIQGLI